MILNRFLALQARFIGLKKGQKKIMTYREGQGITKLASGINLSMVAKAIIA